MTLCNLKGVEVVTSPEIHQPPAALQRQRGITEGRFDKHKVINLIHFQAGCDVYSLGFKQYLKKTLSLFSFMRTEVNWSSCCSVMVLSRWDNIKYKCFFHQN